MPLDGVKEEEVRFDLRKPVVFFILTGAATIAVVLL
jgi:hypothetical protein